jgi:hypothetical protein
MGEVPFQNEVFLAKFKQGISGCLERFKKNCSHLGWSGIFPHPAVSLFSPPRSAVENAPRHPSISKLSMRKVVSSIGKPAPAA